ncbi:FAD-dependent thymidylate synthase [Pasteuria penetrans]|uniref:FAD-dependent thymidylate synthase n=1 Tax=Pasteuria penetrans TaxID=86005 RepID=UPI00165B55DB|nr:FAD-dependent thymidylate synthase [Pasteuria penetrans]
MWDPSEFGRDDPLCCCDEDGERSGGDRISSSEDLLKNFVSNTDRDVYVLFNLPEEVIAVVFAYVSRSSLGFRENLAALLQEDQLGRSAAVGGVLTTHFSPKAASFHEKWVLNYGHSSVAEHAVAHMGIEKISRLASAELALSSSFHSLTEYSQRYQLLPPGAYYTPTVLCTKPRLLSLYHEFQKSVYISYHKLNECLFQHLQTTEPMKEGEGEGARIRRLRKLALEDARYALTLAFHTHLGMTANGRSLRTTLVHLLTSPYAECQTLARVMEEEVRCVIPTLLRYIQPSDYLLSSRRELGLLLDHLGGGARPTPTTGGQGWFPT